MNKQSNRIDQYIIHVKKLCQEIEFQNLRDFRHSQETANDNYLQVNKTDDLLFDIADHKVGKRRRRRNVFNFIRGICKV
jgi:hypothetical protein